MHQQAKPPKQSFSKPVSKVSVELRPLKIKKTRKEMTKQPVFH